MWVIIGGCDGSFVQHGKMRRSQEILDYMLEKEEALGMTLGGLSGPCHLSFQIDLKGGRQKRGRVSLYIMQWAYAHRRTTVDSDCTSVSHCLFLHWAPTG